MQTLKNEQPMSLLLICGKLFEQLIYNKMYEVSTENNLFLSNKIKT